MLGKTHIINSLAITAGPLVFIDDLSLSINYIVFMMFVALGSILPDIDEPNSIIGSKFSIFSTAIKIFLGHRTITHNLLLFSITLFLLFVYLKESWFLIAINVGILLHILQDSITYQGIKNGIFPLQRFNYNFVLAPRFFRFAVGSVTEKIILLFSILFLIYSLSVGIFKLL